MVVEDAAQQLAGEQAQGEAAAATGSIAMDTHSELFSGTADRKRQVWGGVPVSLKKPQTHEKPVGVERLPMLTMLAVAQASGDGW